jgi:glycosyltransferase involved in cell wall biosynthesis
VTQESQKRRIVLASLLKPVDDTRMTEKMGASLANTGQYDVVVIGYPSAAPLPAGVRALPLRPFRRLSAERWLARWQAFRLAFSVRAELFIFSTHELIFPALALKVILGTQIIYDVRENYYRNILHSEGLPRLIRWPLAVLVRMKEKVFAPAIDYFLLAEKGYEQEFRFHRGGWTVIENKALDIPTPRRKTDPQHITLLFSGTLSESTGVFRAIHLAEVLHREHPEVRLIIAGYAASGSVRERLVAAVKDKPFIRTMGIDRLVPHGEILDLIASANAGVIAYRPLPHIVNSVPTKLYEYLQARLPILTENHWPWVNRFASSRPFVFTDFENPDPGSVLNSLNNNSLYTETPIQTGWNEEATRLLSRIKLMV